MVILKLIRLIALLFIAIYLILPVTVTALQDDEMDLSDSLFNHVSTLDEFIKKIPFLNAGEYDDIFHGNSYFLIPNYDVEITSVSWMDSLDYFGIFYTYNGRNYHLLYSEFTFDRVSGSMPVTDDGIYYGKFDDGRVYQLWKLVDGELMQIVFDFTQCITPDEIDDYKELFNLKRYYYDDSVDIVEPIEPCDCVYER